MSNLAWDEQEEGAASPAAALVGTGLLNIFSVASSVLGTCEPIILEQIVVTRIGGHLLQALSSNCVALDLFRFCELWSQAL